MEEAKPILGGAEIADYVAEVNNFQKVLFWSHFYEKVWQIFLHSICCVMRHQIFLQLVTDYWNYKLCNVKTKRRFFWNFCGLLKIPEFLHCHEEFMFEFINKSVKKRVFFSENHKPVHTYNRTLKQTSKLIFFKSGLILVKVFGKRIFWRVVCVSNEVVQQILRSKLSVLFLVMLAGM